MRRVLLVDNYDSYTYNLYQLVGQVTGVAPVVVRNDALGTPASIDREFSHVVLSPGPGTPADPRRVGGCPELIAGTRLPLLGVCLGHQALALAFGGTVAPVTPRHGHVSTVGHDGRGVLAGLPQGLRVVRYHSLAVTGVPGELEVGGRAEDGTVMALRHRDRPLHGVQFHPESVGTEHGRRLIANFLGATPRPDRPSVTLPAPARTGQAGLLVREVPWREPEDVFAAHYAGRPCVAWLDSADARPGGAQPEPGFGVGEHPQRCAGRRRMSYLGAPEGPRGHVVSYRLGGAVRVDGQPVADPDIFAFLGRRLGGAPVPGPFPFCGGYVGYLGYELKELCGGEPVHRADTEDAALLYVERFLAFDHDARRAYAAAVAGPGERAEAEAWLGATARMVAGTRPAPAPGRDGEMSTVDSDLDYGRAFATVRRHLDLGDTYEVNLTYRLRFTCTADHAELYRHLRRTNPAPHAAFLRVPGATVLSASPERFLRLGPQGTVEARPIKGTLPRHPDPRADEVLRGSLGRDPKTFAENLMIVDLLRNDLGQVCRLGSVAVPELMAVESYPTVHQLVSTVTGVLAPGVDAVAAVRAAFPGGSMTGAPKLRTMEIIDAVERDARGVYSGALGYFSLSGEADLSIVIRTIVARGTRMSIGVGGGVVSLSREADERAEAELKSVALLAAVRRACAPSGTAEGEGNSALLPLASAP
ncbi:MAG TPA: aminodeoxychorismate synthase component I [Rugosimonospora sp.]|nr:aminodeoxychorismate synthase component I [Rugosimonospora sp.]